MLKGIRKAYKEGVNPLTLEVGGDNEDDELTSPAIVREKFRKAFAEELVDRLSPSQKEKK